MILIITLWIFLFVGTAHAHPGRLNEYGCHQVEKDFVYTSKYNSAKVAKKGEYHCHRTLNKQKGIRLDGYEVLQDEKPKKTK